MYIWLDDERPMPKGFDTHVKTYTHAIYLLSLNGDKIEYISFDNDLGEGKEGRHVADHIANLAYHGKLHRISWGIHSANPVGRRAISAAMNQAEKYWDEQERM